MATKKSTTVEPADTEIVETPEVVEIPEAVETPAEVAEADETPVEVVDEPVVEPAPEAVAAASTPAPTHEVIVVDAPVAPRKRGNRLLGIGLALLGALVLAFLLAVIAALVPAAHGPAVSDPVFYFPSILFFIGASLVNIVLNRAGWWSHIAGSVVVGLIVWFGNASLVLLSEGMLTMNQTEANDVFYAALFAPLSVVAALLAREIAVWIGAILARRGRVLKVRNVEAQQAYEREQAELTPTA